MKKDKVTMFAEESYNDLDDNIGIVMPILTDCDVDEDFTCLLYTSWLPVIWFFFLSATGRGIMC